MVSVVAIAATGGAAAGNWSSQYVDDGYVCGICMAMSDYNSGISFNMTGWNTSGNNGADKAYLTLCNSNQVCYQPAELQGGYGQDTRSISYGRASCFAQKPSWYFVFFDYCYTDNF